MPLRSEWSFMQPPKIRKKSFEKNLWRCRFCKSEAVRFSSVTSVKKHITQTHSLVRKGDITDLEPPSASSNTRLCNDVTKEWQAMKSKASQENRKKITPKKQRDDARNQNTRPVIRFLDGKNRRRIY